jgi:hypothetical protein
LNLVSGVENITAYRLKQKKLRIIIKNEHPWGKHLIPCRDIKFRGLIFYCWQQVTKSFYGGCKIGGLENTERIN